MQTFYQVATHQSLTMASRALGLSVAAVSKQINQLEIQLGVVLFTRSTRKVALTSIGEAYYHEVQNVFGALEQADSVINSVKAKPRGRLRVKSARFFAEKIILPRLPLFQQQYPDIVVDLQIAEEIPHLIEENLDVVFGMSVLLPTQAMQKKISSTRYVFCASPAYLGHYGYPKHLDDLQHHRYITHSMRQPNDEWVFPSGEKVLFKPSLYLNDAEAIVSCVKQGLGIALVHAYQIAESLASKEVLMLFPSLEMPMVPIFLYYHPARFMQPKVRVWIDCMTANIPPCL